MNNGHALIASERCVAADLSALKGFRDVALTSFWSASATAGAGQKARVGTAVPCLPNTSYHEETQQKSQKHPFTTGFRRVHKSIHGNYSMRDDKNQQGGRKCFIFPLRSALIS